MEAFSITECALCWDKRSKTPKRQKQALKSELKGLSSSISKAIKFIKEAALDGSEPTVTWILGADLNYELALFLSNSSESVIAGEQPLFEMTIRISSASQRVAHIYSEKYGVVLGSLEEEDKFLESDTIE